MLVKQAVALSRFHVFPRVSSILCSVPTCCSILCSVSRVALGISAGSSRCCVTSRGKPCWSLGLFDAGSAMLQLLQSLGFASIVCLSR